MNDNKLIVIVLALIGVACLCVGGYLAAFRIDSHKDLYVITGSCVTAIAAIANMSHKDPPKGEDEQP